MKKLLSIIATVSLVTTATAQDMYRQQYFATPLLVSPAMTGLMPTDYRIAAHTRTSVSPYLELRGNLSADFSVLQGKLSEKNGLGVGVVANCYKYPSFTYSGATVGLSTAYHRALDNSRNHILSIGLQGFLNNATRSLSPTFSDSAFNFTIATCNAGLMYSGKISTRLSLYGGYSIYGFNEPNAYFQGRQQYKLQYRSQFFAGGSLALTKNVGLHTNVIHARQDPYRHTALGAHASLTLNSKKQPILYIGARYWLDYALTPYVGLEWKRSKIGFSYDADISDGLEISKDNAFELSYIYSGMFTKSKRTSLTSRAMTIR